MGYQKPKKDHPWRQYANKNTTVTKEDIKDVIPLRIFLSNLVEHWEEYEITTTREFEGNYRHKISTLPQKKGAAWLAGIIRRTYVEK